MNRREKPEGNEKYRHIIDLPHHVSKHHPQMSLYQRAAQFAPFAALTGHSAAIHETARLTDRRPELSEYECSILDRQLAWLLDHLHEQPSVRITRFVPDGRKEGGSYAVHCGTVRKWDDYGQALTFSDGTVVRIRDIIAIEGIAP